MTQKKQSHSYEARLHPLFAAASAGDRQAYAALLVAIGEVAKRSISRKIADDAHRDDVVQEILLSVHKALHTYDSARPCMPWLRSIIHFRLNDWLRKQYHVSEQGKVALHEVEEFLSDPVTKEPLAYEYVTKAVETLTQGQQAVIQAMYQQDMTVAETSEKLGLSISAVKVTAHRAYKKLRRQLEGS